MEEISKRLKVLHDAIEHCRICEPGTAGYKKPVGLKRGEPGKVVIVGQGPGNKEIEASSAFAGQSGTKLNEWLVNSGATETNPRAGIYLTSVTKCVTSSGSDLKEMARNCAPFLEDQLGLLQPNIVITLGKLAFQAIDVTGLSYDDVLCQLVRTEDFALLTRFGCHFLHVPWPHPSGLNRWHNEEENRQRLQQSFRDLKPLFRKAIE